MDKQTQKFVDRYGERKYMLILFLKDKELPIRYIAKCVELPKTTIHYWIRVWGKWDKEICNSGLPKP